MKKEKRKLCVYIGDKSGQIVENKFILGKDESVGFELGECANESMCYAFSESMYNGISLDMQDPDNKGKLYKAEIDIDKLNGKNVYMLEQIKSYDDLVGLMTAKSDAGIDLISFPLYGDPFMSIFFEYVTMRDKSTDLETGKEKIEKAFRGEWSSIKEWLNTLGVDKIPVDGDISCFEPTDDMVYCIFNQDILNNMKFTEVQY